MKKVENLDEARALALSKGAAIQFAGGESFNSGRDKFHVVPKDDEPAEPTTAELFNQIVAAIPEQDNADILESLAELKSSIDAIEIDIPVAVETVVDLTEVIEQLHDLKEIAARENHSDITQAIQSLNIGGIREDIAKFTINDLKEQLILIRKQLEAINLKMVEREEVWVFEIRRDANQLISEVIARGVIS